MKKIPLTRGMVALVDDTDYERLNTWKWYASKNSGSYNSYAVRGIKVAKNKQTIQMMHRVILGLQPGDGRQTDHRDGNGLNNQRTNLRVCTATQNGQSRRKMVLGTSKYKGICWNHRDSKWRSRIYVNRKRIHLGYFSSEKTAAAAYNQAALKHFGEFALLNTF